MRILFISPGYPSEMPYFCRGLAAVGADVVGLGDQQAMFRHAPFSNRVHPPGRPFRSARPSAGRLGAERGQCLAAVARKLQQAA